MNKKLIKNIIIGVVIVVALFMVYRFFAGTDEEPLSSTTPSPASAVEGDLLSLLLELRSISLTDDLLSDPAFATLQDFTVELASEPVGRQNPFAAIGAIEIPDVVEEEIEEEAVETEEETETETEPEAQ